MIIKVVLVVVMLGLAAAIFKIVAQSPKTDKILDISVKPEKETQNDK